MTPARIQARRKEVLNAIGPYLIFTGPAVSGVYLTIMYGWLGFFLAGIPLVLATLLGWLIVAVMDGIRCSKDERKITVKEFLFGP